MLKKRDLENKECIYVSNNRGLSEYTSEKCLVIRKIKEDVIFGYKWEIKLGNNEIRVVDDEELKECEGDFTNGY